MIQLVCKNSILIAGKGDQVIKQLQSLVQEYKTVKDLIISKTKHL